MVARLCLDNAPRRACSDAPLTNTRLPYQNDRRKAEKEKEFEEALRERVGDRMFKYWKSLGPIRRKKQLELWDKEDAKRAVEEAKEQARIDAEVQYSACRLR